MKATSANESGDGYNEGWGGTATYTIKVEQLATSKQMWSKQFGLDDTLVELGVERNDKVNGEHRV